MKKRIFICLAALFLIILPITLPSAINASAETGENVLNESVLEQIQALDLKGLQEYVNSLDGFTDKDVAARLYDYVKGERIDYGGFFKQISDVLFKNAQELFPSFICIVAVTLLCGVMTNLKSGKLSGSGDMIFLISYVSALIPLLGVVAECFGAAKSSVLEMKKQMDIVFPLILTLMAASGGSVSAAICRPAVAFLSVNIVSLISSVVFPLTLTVIAFSMASHLSSDLKFGKFSAFLKSINKWIIGISVSVFGLFFTLQGITAATYDGITRRAAKYAIGNGVPIVGGFLSGGFDLAVAGSALIKNSLGNMSIFLMFSVLFEPIVLLITTNLLLRLTAAITQPFGDSRISDFLGETADNLNYCTAGVLFTAFMYFISIILIVCISGALF